MLYVFHIKHEGRMASSGRQLCADRSGVKGLVFEWALNDGKMAISQSTRRIVVQYFAF